MLLNEFFFKLELIGLSFFSHELLEFIHELLELFFSHANYYVLCVVNYQLSIKRCSLNFFSNSSIEYTSKSCISTNSLSVTCLFV